MQAQVPALSDIAQALCAVLILLVPLPAAGPALIHAGPGPVAKRRSRDAGLGLCSSGGGTRALLLRVVVARISRVALTGREHSPRGVSGVRWGCMCSLFRR